MLSFTSRKPLRADEPFVPDSYLLITAGTYLKKPFIAGDDRKTMLLESMDFNCYKWNWRLVAHAILDNHYHLIVQTPPGDMSRLAHIVQSAHSFSAHHWRQQDLSIRTRIWWNFWESPIEDLQRLRQHINYVHANPRHHGVVPRGEDYSFSSYSAYLALDPDAVRQWEADAPASELTLIDAF